MVTEDFQVVLHPRASSERELDAGKIESIHEKAMHFVLWQTPATFPLNMRVNICLKNFKKAEHYNFFFIPAALLLGVMNTSIIFLHSFSCRST
jgi:hypothetical protein